MTTDDEEQVVVVVVPSTGQFYITGMSIVTSSYATDYDALLDGVMTAEELVRAVHGLNDAIQSHWPCSPVLLFGVLCCPCSLGGSLLFPQFCLTKVGIILQFRSFSHHHHHRRHHHHSSYIHFMYLTRGRAKLQLRSI